MIKGELQASKTYRYFTNESASNPEYLLVALHGYGQLAEFFIRKFNDLSDNILVVAPEGMHRFYLNGTSGRVGASWMTREEREADIRDNLNWLKELDNTIDPSGDRFKKKILLGFSQGGATAARFFYQGQGSTYDSFICWASVFPPDLEAEREITETERNTYFVIGSQDEYFDEDQQREQLKLYASRGYKTVNYKGKHEIEQEVLNSIIKEIHDL